MPRRRPPSRTPRFALGDQPVRLHHLQALRDSPGHRQNQRHHHVRRILGRDAGGVRYQDAALPGGGDVDMVDPGAIIGDQFQLLSRLGQKRGVDRVGDRRDQHIRAPHRLGQLLPRHGHVGVAQLDVEQLLHPRLHGFGQPSRHDHTQATGRHGVLPDTSKSGVLGARCSQAGQCTRPGER
jgi:hypothetical protein